MQLRVVGPNSVEDAAHLSALRLLLRQFESPLVLILIFAAVISLALQQWVDSAIILAIVIGSTLLGFFQEYRASTAVEQLKRRLALTCRVIRDGVERTVPVSTVVPGDLIVLSAGNLIPADGVVIEAVDFLVSEASMTGEFFPVEKRAGIVRTDAQHLRSCGTIAGVQSLLQWTLNQAVRDKMDKDRIQGSVEQAKGKVKEVAGKVTGDAKLETEGKTQQVAGKIQNAVGGFKDAVKKAAND